MRRRISKYSSKLFDRSFTIDKDNSKIKIWKLYDDESQITRYKLEENERIFLFNIKNLGYTGKNINYLNQILGWHVGILYPYLNNLKSDIIGFQYFNKYYYSSLEALNVEDIKNNKFQIFYIKDVNHKYIIKNKKYNNIISHFNYWKMIDNGFYSDAIEYLKTNYPQYLETEKDIHQYIGYSMFVCNWEKYVELCKLLLGYLKFITEKYQFKIYHEYSFVNFIKKYYLEYNKEHNIEPSIFGSQYVYGNNNWENNDYDNDQKSLQYYKILSFNLEFFISMFIYHEGYVLNNRNKLRKSI